MKTRRHRKTHTRRHSTMRKLKGGVRCFDRYGNFNPSGQYNVDGSINDNCPIE
jgi:hypothetical protein